MELKRYQEAREIIQKANKILVVGHIHPDLDSLASELALFQGLKKAGKDVHAWSQTVIPARYRFLPFVEEVRTPPFHEDLFEVAVTVDTPVLERLGNDVLGVIRRARHLINIDHHVSNQNFGTVNLVDLEACASGEVVYQLLKRMNLALDRSIATCIYAAVLTDTGSFRFSNTTASTHELAAEMLRLGVNAQDVGTRVYGSMSLSKVRLFRLVLNRLELAFEGQVSMVTLDTSDYEKAGAFREDAEGFVEYARAIQGVKMALIFEELDKGGMVKVGFRSNSNQYDVNALAKKFGGGGHKAASGARVAGSLSEVKERVLAEAGRMLGRPLGRVQKVLA